VHSRVLGKSGFEVSEVGLGCWQLGGDFGPVDDKTAGAILSAAGETGITFWDTADVYGAGQSESRIGAYRRKHAPNARVATKVGRDAALYPDGYTRAKVRKNIEGSIRRLGVDALDLVQLHCVPPEALMRGELFAWLEDFQDEGLVRAFGASVETLDEAIFAVTQPKLAALQIIFNLFRQDAIERLFPLAREYNVGIIVRLPLASGVLAGRMRKDRAFDPADHRHYNRHGEAFSQGETFSGIPFEQAVDLTEELRGYVPEPMSMTQMSMRWILDHDAVSTVIAGASRPAQVTENVSASDLSPLPPKLHERLAAFYRERAAPAVVVPI
jgi:aryl-alcohol dehydrogenase-like predicted oxidoreductase